MKSKNFLVVGLLVAAAVLNLKAMNHDQEDGMRTPSPVPTVRNVLEEYDCDAYMAKKRILGRNITRLQFSPVRDASIQRAFAAVAGAVAMRDRDQRFFVIGVFATRIRRLNRIKRKAAAFKNETQHRVKLAREFAQAEDRATRAHDELVAVQRELVGNWHVDPLEQHRQEAFHPYNLLPDLDVAVVPQGTFGQMPVVE